jgi:pantoate--beta-alanine ligase
MKMARVVSSIKVMQSIARKLHAQNKTIGFVPTMGYLHQGHLSLVKMAKRYADVVIVSIFVNPIQFGPKEDFFDYPRDFSRDRKLLKKEGVDYIFYPQASAMYPQDYKTFVEVKDLSEKLCGQSRPGHFRGVTTVVAKLFNIVQPDIAVFGAKDYQQAIIIKQMAQDLNFPVKIIIAPTVREKDGLAMSSRNSYLSPGERKEAVVLYKALKTAQSLIKAGERNAQRIRDQIQEIIKSAQTAQIDYIEIVDAKTLEPLTILSGKVLIALAAKFGKARLIDNLTVKVD